MGDYEPTLQEFQLFYWQTVVVLWLQLAFDLPAMAFGHLKVFKGKFNMKKVIPFLQKIENFVEGHDFYLKEKKSVQFTNTVVQLNCTILFTVIFRLVYIVMCLTPSFKSAILFNQTFFTDLSSNITDLSINATYLISISVTHFSSNITYLSSNLTYLSSNLTYLSNNLTYLSNNLTYLSNNLTYLSNNLTHLSTYITHRSVNALEVCHEHNPEHHSLKPILIPIVSQIFFLCMGLYAFFLACCLLLKMIRERAHHEELLPLVSEKEKNPPQKDSLTAGVKIIDVCPADPDNCIFTIDAIEEKRYLSKEIVEEGYIQNQNAEVLGNKSDMGLLSDLFDFCNHDSDIGGSTLTVSDPSLCESVMASSVSVRSGASNVTTKTIDEEYDLRYPRSCGVIINNRNFEFLGSRDGSQCDQVKLEKSLKSFGVDVKLHNDLTVEEMRTCLTQYSGQNHSEMSMFVCCVMTHGSYGELCGVDGEIICIEEITNMFSDQNVPTLKDKPKVFVFVSCQHTVSDSHPALTLPDKHFLVMYSTLLGNSSIRNTETGTPFINCLVRDLNKYGENEDLLNITRNANKHMEADYADSTDLKLACEISSSLDKKLILRKPKK